METTQPIAKEGDETFFQLHEEYLARAKEGPVDLLFLGDSITFQWQKVPHIWDHYYGSYQPARFGIGGDSTQHVIWRIAHGELDHITPRLIVLLIGTNNCGNNSADEITAGIKEIIRRIREKLPTVKILNLGIFPRGPRLNNDGNPDPWEIHMETIRTINAELASFDNGDTHRYLDISAQFLGNDGTIPSTIMPDQVHLTPAGYQLWADAMHPLLQEMMM